MRTHTTKKTGLKPYALVLTVLLISLLSGCMSSAGKKYYQLSLYTPPYAGVTPAKAALHLNDSATVELPEIDKIIMVDKVTVEEIYNDYRVVYRTSPYQLNYYSYYFWVKKPEKVVHHAIVDYLSKVKGFRSVMTGFEEGRPDYMLRVWVHNLEEYDRPGAWWAHLQMEIEIREFPSNNRVLHHRFDRQTQMPAKNVDLLPVYLSSIMKEELNKIIIQLAEKIEKERQK